MLNLVGCLSADRSADPCLCNDLYFGTHIVAGFCLSVQDITQEALGRVITVNVSSIKSGDSLSSKLILAPIAAVHSICTNFKHSSKIAMWSSLGRVFHFQVPITSWDTTGPSLDSDTCGT